VALGVGVVGSGFMGRTWAEVAHRHQDLTRLVGVTGGSRALALARDYGVPCTDDLAGLLARDDVDIIVVATPPAVHLEQVAAAAAAGKHVLVEKPMARDAREGMLMVEHCDRADVRLAVVSQHRFRNAPLAAKKLIDDGEIGAVRMVRVTGCEAWWDMTVTKDEWKLDQSQIRVFADWGAHGCDILRWLVDSPPILAFAQYARYGADPPEDQTAMVMYRFGSGVLAEVLMSYEIPGPGLGSAMGFLVIGSNAMIELDSYGRVQLGRDDTWTLAYEQPAFDPLNATDPARLVAYVRQLGDLVESIDGGRDPIVSGREGVITQQMLDAAEVSARSNSAVQVPGLPPMQARGGN
jgi:predicted dehydrogenase